MPRVLTRAQSRKRVAALRKRGCKVTYHRLPSGDTAVVKKCPKKRRLQDNPSGASLLLVGGAVAAVVGLLVWGRRKKTPPAEPPRRGLPPPAVRALPIDGCVVTDIGGGSSYLNQWGVARDLAVYVYTFEDAPPDWQKLNMIPTFAAELQKPGGEGRIVIFLVKDRSFWGLSNQLVTPSPAHRDDYCAWYAQQQGSS